MLIRTEGIVYKQLSYGDITITVISVNQGQRIGDEIILPRGRSTALYRIAAFTIGT